MTRPRLAALLAVSLVACTPMTRPGATDSPDASVALTDPALPPMELEFAPASRTTAPECVPLGPWTLVRASETTKEYRAPLPIRSRSMYFGSAPVGMEVLSSNGSALPHKRDAKNSGPFWTYTAKRLTVHLPLEQPFKPEHCLIYPKATSRSRRLNFNQQSLSASEFVQAEVQIGSDSRTGLFLPAPARISWNLTVPAAGELHFSPGLLPPEVIDHHHSDGATVVVEVESKGQRTEVYRSRLQSADFPSEHVDLSRWSGQSILLRVRTEPGNTPDLDYVFLGAPAISSRKTQPQRVIFIFIDTLRADHLGTYGYERPTSPNIDTFAEGAVVFEQARSVAPWTLPSVRTLLTGQQPERFATSPTLAGQLRSEGWATAMLAGNVYLSSNFGISRDWELHHNQRAPSATQQIDLALNWLNEVEGRDAFLLLHLMDPHLPYFEPEPFRSQFAGPPVPPLRESFSRNTVKRRSGLLSSDAKKYVVNRYDNNISYLDSELGRLFKQLRPSDIVVLLSDHGEEFWEHGGFEHGHSLYDEVLHVPLMFKAPGLSPSRVQTPVSLIDVVPTLAGLLKLSPMGEGIDLLSAPPVERPIGFGRPLYGQSQWGVVAEQHKYTAALGVERLFDLQSDPDERKNAVSKATPETLRDYRDALGDALDRPVRVAYLFKNTFTIKPPEDDLTLTVDVPGGIERIWLGEDPLARSLATLDYTEERPEQVRITWPAGFRGSREVYLIPKQPLAQTTHAMRFHAQVGLFEREFSLPKKLSSVPKVGRPHLSRQSLAKREFTIGWAVARVPGSSETALDGSSEELSDWLIKLGYHEN